jgi:uncharacterized zinc-type alcohol dehydrogenase-like protein
MGLKFANAWDCEVKAFTSSESKAEEAKRLGAHHIISSRDAKVIAKAASSLDFSVNLPLGWTVLVKTLMPNLRLHVVGPVLERMPISAIDLIFGQKSVWGSPTGGSSTIAAMLDFAIRHNIAPQVDHFSLNTVYDAIGHLVSGKPRYRVVLDVA